MTGAFISDLVAAGADAMTNMFEYDFSGLAGVGGNPDLLTQLRVRVSGFTPPDPKQASYPVSYKTVTITKKATKIELERKLTLQFRLDANYVVYEALKQYREQYCKPEEDVAGNGEPLAVRNSYVIVRSLAKEVTNDSADAIEATLKNSGKGVKTWTFKMPWIEELKIGDFGTDDAKAQTVTCSMFYGPYEEN